MAQDKLGLRMGFRHSPIKVRMESGPEMKTLWGILRTSSEFESNKENGQAIVVQGGRKPNEYAT